MALGHMVKASLRSISRRHSIANFPPSTIQSFICTLCSRVYCPQSGLTHHHHSTHPGFHPNPDDLSASDGLDCEIADNISLFDDDTLGQPLETYIFPHPGAPIDGTVRVHSFKAYDSDPVPPYVPSQQS